MITRLPGINCVAVSTKLAAHRPQTDIRWCGLVNEIPTVCWTGIQFVRITWIIVLLRLTIGLLDLQFWYCWGLGLGALSSPDTLDVYTCNCFPRLDLFSRTKYFLQIHCSFSRIAAFCPVVNYVAVVDSSIWVIIKYISRRVGHEWVPLQSNDNHKNGTFSGLTLDTTPQVSLTDMHKANTLRATPILLVLLSGTQRARDVMITSLLHQNDLKRRLM